MVEYEWTSGRCPCCRKRTEIVLGVLLNETAQGWDNWLSQPVAERYAREGICPWCGRRTTTPTRTLLARFAPTLKRNERSYA